MSVPIRGSSLQNLNGKPDSSYTFYTVLYTQKYNGEQCV